MPTDQRTSQSTDRPLTPDRNTTSMVYVIKGALRQQRNNQPNTDSYVNRITVVQVTMDEVNRRNCL